MDLPINAPIVCTDGSFGRSIAIILNPVNDQVTHVVVCEPGLLGIERMTLVEFVTESTLDLIRLRCTTNELAHMPPFISTSYIPTLPSSVGMLLWAYVTQSEISIAHENTPLDELAIHRGSRGHATMGILARWKSL